MSGPTGGSDRASDRPGDDSGRGDADDRGRDDSDASGRGNADPDGDSGHDGDTLVWLVERTYSDDELNLIILVYATEDGRRYHRRERALTSFSGPARETKAGLYVDADRLGPVDDPETRKRYAAEASRMASRHDPDDAV